MSAVDPVSLGGAAAMKLGTSRSNLHDFIKRHGTWLKPVIEEIKETLLDLAESNVVAGIQNADRAYTLYYLNNKGGKRGYGNRVFVSGDPNGDPIEHSIETAGERIERRIAGIAARLKGKEDPSPAAG